MSEEITTSEDQTTGETTGSIFTVGEREYTPDTAVKKIQAADEHIARIEAENAELREKLTKAASVEDVLNTIRNQPSMDSTQQTAGSSEDDIKRMVEQQVLNLETTRTAEGNVRQADAQMKELYGEKAASVLQTKASQLGLDVNSLQDIAAKSPSAFMQLVADKASTPSPAPSTGGLNTETVASMNSNGPAQGTYAYYQQIKRDNPNLYHSASVQNQMMKDAERLGKQAFFGG